MVYQGLRGQQRKRRPVMCITEHSLVWLNQTLHHEKSQPELSATDKERIVKWSPANHNIVSENKGLNKFSSLTFYCGCLGILGNDLRIPAASCQSVNPASWWIHARSRARVERGARRCEGRREKARESGRKGDRTEGGDTAEPGRKTKQSLVGTSWGTAGLKVLRKTERNSLLWWAHRQSAASCTDNQAFVFSLIRKMAKWL